MSEVDCFITLAPGYIKIFADSLGLSEGEQKKFVSLPNMVRPPKGEVTLLDRPKKIIFMGRLSYADKRADRLIYIWEQIHRELPEWSVEIYGQGKEEKYLRALIKDKQLPRISLRGYAPDPSLIYPVLRPSYDLYLRRLGTCTDRGSELRSRTHCLRLLRWGQGDYRHRGAVWTSRYSL